MKRCREKAMKTTEIHLFIASHSSVLFDTERRRTLLDLEHVSLPPAQRTLQEIMAAKLVIPAAKVTHIRADFWEGDATKHFSVKKRGFQ